MILVAPFQIDDLKKIVSGEIEEIEIDLASSKLKNQSLLTYIYNLNLSKPKLVTKDMTLEARRDLFLSYISHKTIVDLDSLSASYLQFLFFLKEITEIDPDATEELLEKSIFTPEEIETLMQTDTELREAIEHAAFLLDGIIVKIMLSMNNISLLADQNFQDIAVVRDNNWIGYTWVNLLKNPIFNINYYSKMPQLNELVYFPYYYEESIYKGQPMLNFLGESPILVSLMDMALENIKETTT